MDKTYQLKKINFSFENEQLFLNSEITFIKNNIVSIIGQNGVGKTTLLKIISGLIDSDFEIYCGKNFLKKDDFIKKLIYIPNKNTLYDTLSYKQNAQIIRYLWGKNKSYLNDVQKILKILNFDIHNDRPISTYSDGMKQKVNFAIFLSLNKEIVILDEPFTQMDTDSFNKSIYILKEYVNSNKIVVYSAHNKELINSSDLVYKIKNNKVIEKESYSHG